MGRWAHTNIQYLYGSPNQPTLLCTYTAVALWGRLCWLTCGPFPSIFPACLQTIYFSLIHNTSGLEHAKNKVALDKVTCNDCSCLVQ